jgi:flagellar operon protein
MTKPLPVNPNEAAARTEYRPLPGQLHRPAAGSAPSFADALASSTESQELKFSNHAQKRLQTRNIALNDAGLARLAQAVDKAEQRGGRESLVLMDDLAFIVNVKNRLVVTAMDAGSRKDGVFTQIDSVVFAEEDNT